MKKVAVYLHFTNDEGVYERRMIISTFSESYLDSLISRYGSLRKAMMAMYSKIPGYTFCSLHVVDSVRINDDF